MKFKEFRNDTQDQFLKRLELIKDKFIIIDFSEHNCGEGTVSWYHRVLTDLKLNFLILSFNPSDHQIESNIFYYPYWQICLLNSIKSDINYSNNRKYKISCPNKNPRPHRILNFILLKNKFFFKDILFTFQNAYEPGGTLRPDDIILPKNCVEEWDFIKNKLPSFPVNNPMQINDPIWEDSYVNFVTEHTVNKSLYITEKTWKPIASEQLFLIFGNAGTVDYLRNIGIDTFDDIIDHDYYDKIHNPEDRLHRLHFLLEHIMSLDLNLIFNQTSERRSQNRINFLNGKFTKKYINAINQKIQEILNLDAKQF